MIRIALVGDYNETITAHRAIPIALTRAAKDAQIECSFEWLHTSEILADVTSQLSEFAGIWCVPGSPYANTTGALATIRFARTFERPFLGTCGGFQHAVLEYATEIWGIENAAHAETDPAAVDPVITPLECTLIEVAESITLVRGTRLAHAYGRESIVEGYHCRYGLSPRFSNRLDNGPLRASARDASGAIRGIELDTHPFFVATLFQPERAALKGLTPPVVKAFVEAASSADARLRRESVPQ